MGSASKKHVSLYNAKVYQIGLNDVVHACVGQLGTESVPASNIYSFDTEMVTFDEKPEEDEEKSPVEKIRLKLGKSNAVCSGNFWRLTKVWKMNHFILFSDHRLEYYKDNTGTTKAINNPISHLELRGTYDLSSVVSLTPTYVKHSTSPSSSKKKNKTSKNLTIEDSGLTRSHSSHAKSFRAVKSLLGLTPTSFVLEMKVFEGKSAKFAFDSEEQMLEWYRQMKVFSVFVQSNVVDTLTPFGDHTFHHLSQHTLKTERMASPLTLGSEEILISSAKTMRCGDTQREAKREAKREEWAQLSVNSKWDRRTFWIRVVGSGMKFSIIDNTCVETLWNLYARVGKDCIGKNELTDLLTDWMTARQDNFEGKVKYNEAEHFLDNISERALQAKRYLNVSQNGKVIFQEFKRIKKKAFWKLMDESIPVEERTEAKKMWKRVLSSLAECGVLGDDEAFEVWERYDSKEDGTLTLEDISTFLQDWITSIGKIYPGAVERSAIDNFLGTINIRAILVAKFLDPDGEGVTFKMFQKIQDVEFWQHVDHMMTFDIPCSNVSKSDVNLIHSELIKARPKEELSRMSKSMQNFSWSYCKQQDLEADEEWFILPASQGDSPSESPRGSSSSCAPLTRVSDAGLEEDPILNRKLNNLATP